MKVLHLIKSLGRGGAEVLLLETLKKHQSEKYIFHYIFFLPWKDQMKQDLENAGGVVTNFPAKNNFQIILQLFKIIRFVRNNNISLIHCHLPWAGILGRLVGFFVKVPVVYTEHNKQERYHYLTRFFNRITFRMQHGVVAVSDDVKASIKKNIKFYNQICTIYNGVDTEQYKRDVCKGMLLRQSYNIPIQSKVIGTIAVFRSQKRLKEWVDVFIKIHENNPDVIGLLIGDGILNNEIRKYIKDAKMENHIILPGFMNNAKDWYSVIDIYMMTSEFEGLPLALLEAMSCKCAVAVTDAGGIKEVVIPNIGGIIVNVDHYQELIPRVSALIQDTQLIKWLGENARERVVNEYSIEVMVKRIESFYLEINQMYVDRRIKG